MAVSLLVWASLALLSDVSFSLSRRSNSLWLCVCVCVGVCVGVCGTLKSVESGRCVCVFVCGWVNVYYVDIPED